MFESQSQSVFELVRDQRLIPSDQLEVLNAEHIETGKPLADVLLAAAAIDREALLEQIAESLGLEYMPSPPSSLPDDVIGAVNGSLARMLGVVPIRSDSRTIDVLCVDPFNSMVVHDLTFALGKDIRMVVADPERVSSLLKTHYGEEDASIDQVLAEMSSTNISADVADITEEDLEAMAGQTPIIRFVNLVLAQAIRDRASDIHFEPFENEFKIRYRIDGALYEMAPPPKHLALPITSRIKVIANLNIAERRLPQDGRIKLTLSGRPVDLRVSTLPTQFGESLVLRVLDQSVVNLDIKTLGMPADVLAGVNDIIRRPNGIFIVTGPTGSGKTTTLYSCLRVVNSPETKLLTAEDPVEYEIEGITQVPVNPLVGLNFASALRSFLRQDPDVIMVGEIRDLETAQIAIQASLTGHLVLSTLHTNDASGAVTRLIDMGLEPFLIASTLEAILAQRLVRRICKQCRQPFAPSSQMIAQLGIGSAEAASKQFFYGKGCVACNQTGYKGRMGIYEFLQVTDAIRDLITKRAPTLMMREKALEQGMRTLREDGQRAIFDGASTIEEVLKYT
jgi:type IV pilus assembly protein PilB